MKETSKTARLKAAELTNAQLETLRWFADGESWEFIGAKDMKEYGVSPIPISNLVKKFYLRHRFNRLNSMETYEITATGRRVLAIANGDMSVDEARSAFLRGEFDMGYPSEVKYNA